MKHILILGAGQVGYSLAAALHAYGYQVVVVDRSRERLQALKSDFGIRGVIGHAALPSVQAQAGAADASLLIAVTDSDEVNLTACLVAKRLFHIETRIARVRSRDYHDYPQLYRQEAIPVDLLISPEALVTEQLERLIQYPGALQVLDFADGRVSMVAVRAHPEDSLVGHALRHLPKMRFGMHIRIVAIFRDDCPIRPVGDTVIKPGDEVFFVTARKHILPVAAELGHLERPNRRVTIAGGGHIGKRLAENLHQQFRVRLIEKNPVQAQQLAQELPSEILVLQGDAADDEFLDEIEMNHVDVFCAMTNDDQVNIFSSMLAKRKGARKVISLINRPSYVDLVQGGSIDIAISPQLVTVSAVLARVREGGMLQVHSLRRGAAEAIETLVYGDARTSRVVNRRLDEIRFPESTRLGAIVREDRVIIPHHDTIIQQADHLILFVSDRQQVPQVQRLFQPSPLFF